MKKIFVLPIMFFFSFQIYSQTSTFVLNNYSSMNLEGTLFANANSGSCFPSVTSGNGSWWSVFVQPGTAANPSVITYDKYALAGAAATNYPLSQWWVQSAATSTPGYRGLTHPSIAQTGAIANNTNWTGFYFVTRNASGYHEEHPIGNPLYSSCTGCFFTYNDAGITEAEWFTLTSGGVEYTYVQVYDI